MRRPRSLRPDTAIERLYLYRFPVDFRLGYRGLSALVEREFGHDPFSGALYAFTNRRHDKIKILLWENSGFVLYYKALAEERFRWPGPGERLMTIDGEQLNWLLDGYDIAAMRPHRVLRYEAIC